MWKTFGGRETKIKLFICPVEKYWLNVSYTMMAM